MPLMLSKTYDALLSAGAPDDKAREAAEELADYEARLASFDARLDRAFVGIDTLGRELANFRAEVKARFSVLTWAIGINAAATIAILGVLLHHP
jgi:hypothetical protein